MLVGESHRIRTEEWRAMGALHNAAGQNVPCCYVQGTPVSHGHAAHSWKCSHPMNGMSSPSNPIVAVSRVRVSGETTHTVGLGEPPCMPLKKTGDFLRSLACCRPNLHTYTNHRADIREER